jgi:hypothetical protein
MTSNSTTVFQIAKWSFLFVALWYAVACGLTWYDTEEIVAFDGSEYTMWYIRAYLGATAAILWAFLFALEEQ